MLRDEGGAASLEFAIVCTTFLALLFGLFDLGRAIWTYASLQAAATVGARCYAVQQTCTSVAATATYLSTLTGVTVSSANLSVGTCNGSNSTKLTISTNFNFVAPGLIGVAGTLPMSVSGCYG